MTDDKKHDDKDRKKLSDEELEDVAGGTDTSGHGKVCTSKDNNADGIQGIEKKTKGMLMGEDLDEQ
jgi:hypothetical protein